jgi:hypothetical protein
MSDIKDGGPAFPSKINTDYEIAFFPGMTLRDYFAGQAIQAVFANNWEMFLDNTFQSPEEVPHEVARDAYAIADAMLAAREVQK